MTARSVLDGMKARVHELQEDRAKAAMWRTADVARLVAAVEGVLVHHIPEGNGNCSSCWDFKTDEAVKSPCPTVAAIENALVNLNEPETVLVKGQPTRSQESQ